MGAIGIERHGQAVALEDGAQGGHDRRHTLAAFTQLGVEEPLGGVVDDGDQGEPLLGHQGEPLMATAIEVQQLAEARPWLPPTPMAAARPVLDLEPGRLQGLFHERVAEAHAVLPPSELVKVSDVEALVAVAIELQHALQLGDGRSLGRRGLAAAIEQAVISEVLQSPP